MFKKIGSDIERFWIWFNRFWVDGDMTYHSSSESFYVGSDSHRHYSKNILALVWTILINLIWFLLIRVTVMLVTSLCWWLYDGDWFEMLVAESLCWRFESLFWWFSHCIWSVTNILNRSLTSQTCHQHIWSPTSVTNIDVTLNTCLYLDGCRIHKLWVTVIINKILFNLQFYANLIPITCLIAWNRILFDFVQNCTDIVSRQKLLTSSLLTHW